MLLLLFRGSHGPIVAPRQYPLAGVAQVRPLAGALQTYPLAGQTQNYPLG